MTRTDSSTAPRTRPDGSIDTAYYMARGRRMRSQQAHHLAGRASARLPALGVVALTVLAAMVALPFAI